MTFAARAQFDWQLRTRSLTLGEHTLVMGILNVTPDSFSESGAHYTTETAVARGLRLLDAGADILDVGGESTRPGSRPLIPEEEQDRILPVVAAILRERPQCVISIDTYHAATARAAVAAGAEIVNDVSGFAWDSTMPQACAELACGVILMHSRGRPSEWRNQPRLAANDVIPLVKTGLAQSLATASAVGISRDHIVLDPGFGFGKVHDENYPLLAHLDELLALGQPLLAGVSRKSFLGNTLAKAHARPRSSSSADVPCAAAVPPQERGHTTLAASTAAILAGASLIRVHDVRPAIEAAAIADAILEAL